MNSDLILLAVIVLLTLLFVLRRTHVALTTLALCGGYVLSDKVSYALTQTADSYIDNPDLPIYNITKIALLFGPALFVAYYFRRTQRGSSRIVEQLVPAFSLSLLSVVFILEQLASATRNRLLDESVALNQLWQYTPWIILFAFFAALFDVLLHKPHERRNKKI